MLPDDPFLSFLLGVAVTYLSLKYRTFISERSNQISDHIKDLERLAACSVKLWVDTEGKKATAAEVQLNHRISVHVFSKMVEQCPNHKEEYSRLMYELFKEIDADSFLAGEAEACDMAEDDRIRKAQKITDTASQLIFLLRVVRSEVATLGYTLDASYRALVNGAKWIDDNLLKP